MPAPTVARSIDALLAVDPALDAAGLKEQLIELSRARARLDAAESDAIAEFDQRGDCVDDGMINTRCWLAHHTGVPRAVAGGRVLQAKRLRRMPEMADALTSGLVTDAHARTLGRCLTPRTVAALVRDESLLVAKAKDLEADDFDTLITRWLFLNDQNGPDPGSERPSEFRASSMLAGHARLDGELDFEDSAEFLAELDTLYDELWREDQAADDNDPLRTRTHAQRNAAALLEMARRSSAAGGRDINDDDEVGASRPRRPQLVAVVDLDALAGDPAGIAELDDGTPVPQSILQRWLCDSSIGRVVMAGRSLPVDLGASRTRRRPVSGER